MESNGAARRPSDPMRTIDLPQGRVRYRESGSGAPIVFVHGLLVNGTLWRKVTPHLQGDFRCIVPDLPLGSHSPALAPGADRSPRGVAHLLADLLAALRLEDVTLVANDTGGAVAQLMVAERPERVARLVLTPCDLYENFLPPAFRPLQWAARMRLLGPILQTMRVRSLRRLPVAYGALTREPIPDEVLDGWVAPFLRDAGVRGDVTAFVRAIDSRETVRAVERLREIGLPVLLAWAPEDPFFKLRFAERLVDDVPEAHLELVPDSRTFMPEDQPQRLAELVADFARRPASAPARAAAPH